MQRRQLADRVVMGQELAGMSPAELSRQQLTVDAWVNRWRAQNRPMDVTQGQSRVVPSPSSPPGTTATGTASPPPVPTAPIVTFGPDGRPVR
jgi:hypothetical protein